MCDQFLATFNIGAQVLVGIMNCFLDVMFLVSFYLKFLWVISCIEVMFLALLKTLEIASKSLDMWLIMM